MPLFEVLGRLRCWPDVDCLCRKQAGGWSDGELTTAGCWNAPPYDRLQDLAKRSRTPAERDGNAIYVILSSVVSSAALDVHGDLTGGAVRLTLEELSPRMF
jgi:hypothetical protein